MSKKTTKPNKIDELFDESAHEFVRTGLYMRKDLHKLLAEASQDSGHSVNKIVNKIIAKFFEVD